MEKELKLTIDEINTIITVLDDTLFYIDQSQMPQVEQYTEEETKIMAKLIKELRKINE